MTNGYNKELGDRIIIAKGKYITEVKYDAQGNVLRDYTQEIRLVAERETNNLLTEVPVGYFDGCKLFAEHIKKEEEILPIVRQVKLAQLIEKKHKFHLGKYLFNILNSQLGKYFSKNDMPVYNKSKINRRTWALNNILKKYYFTKK